MKDFWKLSKIVNRSKHKYIISFIWPIFIVLVISLWGACAISTFAREDSAELLLNKADAPLERSATESTNDLSNESILATADQLTHEFKMTQEKFKLYQCILLASFALIALLTVLGFLSQRPGCNARNMVNASGLVFIIFGTLFLVLLADADEQLNAAIGIMGAVAGYLFGTMDKVKSENISIESNNNKSM